MAFSNFISKLFGKIANINFPPALQLKINVAYVRHFKIDLSEFESLEHYKSLNALFTRKLVTQRKLDTGFISPSDGKILECGSSVFLNDESFALSIKGFTYSIDALLKGVRESRAQIKDIRAFDYINIYLSPKDYHRYHSPCDMSVKAVFYTAGVLKSVNEKSLQKVPNLYAKNERFTLLCESAGKCFFMVFVGALNVGKMHFSFDESLQKRASLGLDFRQEYESVSLKKGEELGHFELGSTIVLLFKKDDFKLCIKPYESVKFGQKIADF